MARIRSPHLTDLPPFSIQPGRSAGGGGRGTLGLPGAAAAGPMAHAGACGKQRRHRSETAGAAGEEPRGTRLQLSGPAVSARCRERPGLTCSATCASSSHSAAQPRHPRARGFIQERSEGLGATGGPRPAACERAGSTRPRQSAGGFPTATPPPRRGYYWDSARRGGRSGSRGSGGGGSRGRAGGGQGREEGRRRGQRGSEDRGGERAGTKSGGEEARAAGRGGGGERGAEGRRETAGSAGGEGCGRMELLTARSPCLAARVGTTRLERLLGTGAGDAQHGPPAGALSCPALGLGTRRDSSCCSRSAGSHPGGRTGAARGWDTCSPRSAAGPRLCTRALLWGHWVRKTGRPDVGEPHTCF